MKKSLFLCVMALCIAIVLIGCNSEITPTRHSSEQEMNDLRGNKILLNGSTSMSKLCNALGERFMEIYPDIEVEKSDTGSGAALKSVIDGNALIGDMSRNLKDSEKSEDIQQVTIAIDGIVIIIHKNNKIVDVRQEDIMDIFTGKIKNWSELGGGNLPITVIGREESSGTREGFEEALNVSGKCTYNAEYPEAGDILSKVSSDESAIGYVSLFSVGSEVRAVSIDKVEPNEENILSGKYSIKRPFIQIYLKNNHNDLIEKWFGFIGSKEGKQIIKSEKLIPVDIIF